MAAILNPVEPMTQKVILHNISWETYERLLAEHQESAGTRFSYDRGALEIMILSLRHERLKHALATLVELLAEELNLDVEGAGSTTFRRQDLARGFEPDSCFYLANAEYIRRKDEIDLARDPAPELVIEIDLSNPSLNKFLIFSSLGVSEVWRYDGAQVLILRLQNGAYSEMSESAALPGVTSDAVSHLLERGLTMKRADWRQSVREWVRTQIKKGLG